MGFIARLVTIGSLLLLSGCSLTHRGALERLGWVDSNVRDVKLLQEAYNAGNKKAAILLFSYYAQQGKQEVAYQWLERARREDVARRLYEVLRFLHGFDRKAFERYLAWAKGLDPIYYYGLGRYWESVGRYQLAKKAYERAYQAGSIDAGVALGSLLLYREGDRKGYVILRKIASQSGRAALKVGDYLLKVYLPKQLAKLNGECITYTFKEADQFYRDKTKLLLTYRRFLQEVVAQWYRLAYEKGIVDGMVRLIKIDVDRGWLGKKESVSGMDLAEAIHFLKRNARSNQARLLLARIYELYPELKRWQEAKKIYQAYMEVNATSALWHLYNYAKRYEPRQKELYLRPLLKHRFLPAMIEEAAIELERDENVTHNLRFLASIDDPKAQRYRIAYLLRSKEDVGELLRRLCIQENGLSRATDFKIADYFLDRDLVKSKAIFYFYTQDRDGRAEYRLAKIYQMESDLTTAIHFLRQSAKKGYLPAKIALDRYIVRGLAEGDRRAALARLENHYKKHGDLELAKFLAGVYMGRYELVFDPERVEHYIKEAVRQGYKEGYLELGSFYELFNMDGCYDRKIRAAYEAAYAAGVEEAAVRLVELSFKSGDRKETLRWLQKVRDPSVRAYYRYLLEGDIAYLLRDHGCYGPSLLQKANYYLRKSADEALYYGLLAYRQGVKESVLVIYKAMERIADRDRIRAIYRKSLRYRCKGR